VTSSAQLQPLIQAKERLDHRLKEIPLEPGIYFMHDRDDQILYIGKSKQLRARVRSYFRDPVHHSPRIELMVRQVIDIE
jgi:excinuclease ABC subunit C